MDEQGLCRAITSFQGLLQSSKRLDRQDHVATALGLLFAMWCAFRVRREFGFDDDVNTTALVQPAELPEVDAVQDAAKRLLAAARSNDQAGASKALADMGVPALCPALPDQIIRIESVARSVPGRARLVLLVELSLFSAEIGDYARASEYAAEIRALSPSGYELYNVCTVEGLIAQSLGLHDEAIKLLESALSACLQDEYTSLACGVRGLNLMLVEKLLDCGKVAEVRKHLCECKDIWRSFRVQIGGWVSLIDEGARPNFHECVTLQAMNEPGFRLLMQYARARFIDEQSNQADSKVRPTMSPAEIAMRREKLREEYRRCKNERFGPDQI